MEQISLLTLLFGAASAQQPTRAQTEFANTEPEFVLALQQQLSTGKLPQLAIAAEEPVIDEALLEQLANTAETDHACLVVDIKPEEALSESLSARWPLFSGWTESSSVASSSNGLAATQSFFSQTPAESLPDLQQIAQALAAEVQKALVEESAIDHLKSSWPTIIARTGDQLLAEAELPLTLASTSPEAAGSDNTSPLTPWSVLNSSAELVPSVKPLELSPATQTGYEALSEPKPWTSSGDTSKQLSALKVAPASVQWLAQQGIIGQTSATPISTEGTLLGHAELQLSNGNEVQIEVTPLQDSLSQVQYGEQVGAKLETLGSYNVVLRFSGDQNATVHATLAITRVPAALARQAGYAEPASSLGATSTYHGGDISSEFDTGTGLRKIEPTSLARLVSTSSGIKPDSLPILSSEIIPSLVRLNASSKPGMQLTYTTGTDATLASTDEQQPIGQEQARAVPAVLPAVSEEAKINTPVETKQSVDVPFFSVDHALTILSGGSSTVAALDTLPRGIVRGAGLSKQAGLTSTSESVGTPAATYATVPVELMQFSETGIETVSYQGLDYVELAERVFSEVAAAREGGDGLYHARLTLNPPNLGQMFVNISVRGEQVALQLAVVSTVPKEQLQDSLSALKRSLEKAGLEIVDLRIVTLDPEQEESNGRDTQQQSHNDNGQENASQKAVPTLGEALKGVPAINW